MAFARPEPRGSIGLRRGARRPPPAQTDGAANALYLTSRTILSPSVQIEDTETFDAPVVIPLETPLELRAGQETVVSLSYRYGGGYQQFSAALADSGLEVQRGPEELITLVKSP